MRNFYTTRYIANGCCIALLAFLFGAKLSMATWCVAGTSNRGAITPTTTSQNTTSFNPTGLVPHWNFAGTAGVTYYFSLCSSANTDDAILNVYSGASSAGALVAANDDACGTKSALTFVCPANGTYYIAANRYPWFSFSNTGGLVLTYYICGATTGASLPYAEDWSTSNVTTACTNWMAHGAGGEGDWYMYSATNYAGGAGNEVGIQGNQADLYGSDATLTATLTSPKINTTGLGGITFSFRQALYSDNQGTTGLNTITVKVQSSSDRVTWTDRYSQACLVNGPGCCLETEISPELRTVSIPVSGPDTWIRFYINANMFKVWGWFIDSGQALPIDLLSFSAEKAKSSIVLNWKTASEMNNDYFSIERSTDGRLWNAVGTVQGAGNSSTTRNYEFLDHELPVITPDATLYYRLKQTDYDGRFEYFGPLSIKLSLDNEWELIIKNPASEKLEGIFITNEKANVTIDIIDLQGRVIRKEKLTAIRGSNLLQIDLSNIENGVYFVKICDLQNLVLGKFAHF